MTDPQFHAGGAENSVNVRQDERRLVGRALACWEEVRGERPFPDRNDFDTVFRDRLDGSIFLVAIGGSEDTDHVVESDNALIEALGLNPVGRKVIDVLPSATEKGLSFCRTAADLRKPIADVGHFTNAEGEDVYYRSVLLPLSDDQVNINYLIGAFSFKTVN